MSVAIRAILAYAVEYNQARIKNFFLSFFHFSKHFKHIKMTLKKFIEFATLKIPDYLASLNLDEMSARDIKNAVDEQEPFEFLN